jgi:hypothetical protein
VAASKSTVERVLEVILKHVPKETALKILEELMTVPGDKSFRGMPSGQTTTQMINVYPEISISRVRTLATKRKSGSVLARVKSGLIRPARENSQAEDIYRTFELRLHVKIINLKSADPVAALLPRQLRLAGRFSLSLVGDPDAGGTKPYRARVRVSRVSRFGSRGQQAALRPGARGR